MSNNRMRWLAILAAAGLFTAGGRLRAGAPASQPAPDSLALVGKPAPDFKLLGLDGKSHPLAEAKGHVLVLDFWATWCVPCHLELPHLQKMYQAQSAAGLMLFAVETNDDTSKAQKYIQDNNMTLPVLLDADSVMATSYKVDDMPQTVIVGKDGLVKKVFIGFNEKTSPSEMEAAVAAAMAETVK